MGIIAALIIGGIAGWLAGLIVRGAGFGLLGNIVIGIIGAVLDYPTGPSIVAHCQDAMHDMLLLGADAPDVVQRATIGAVIILVILSLIRR